MKRGQRTSLTEQVDTTKPTDQAYHHTKQPGYNIPPESSHGRYTLEKEKKKANYSQAFKAN